MRTTPSVWSALWSATTRSSVRATVSGASKGSRFIFSYLDRLKLERESRKNKRVAIIGSGPAGITISVLLAQKGYDVTLFEGRDKIGGVLRYGIPDFRLPKSILDRYRTQLIQLGIKIRPNTVIGPTLSLDDLQRDGYQAIFIGTGVWRPRKLNIPGE